MTDRILAFVPAYNCQPQIGRVLAQFNRPVGRFVKEVLVLDNGSRDGTVEAAIAAVQGVTGPRVTIGRNKGNYGLGGSHKSAFAYAAANGFTHVLILHGDDQGDLSDMEGVLAEGLHNRFDACMGARFARGSSLRGYSAFRRFGNHVFNGIFTAASRRRVTDLGSGLNILARSAFTDPAVTRHADDLRFNVFLLLGMFDSNRRVHFFPISWREEDQVSNVKMASQAVKTLGIAADFALRRRRFREEDHRDVAHDSYVFDTLASFTNGARTDNGG